MNLNKHIEDLCHAVSKESDGEKLLSLVDELNKELEHASETPAKDGVPQPAELRLPQPPEMPAEGKSKPNAA